MVNDRGPSSDEAGIAAGLKDLLSAIRDAESIGKVARSLVEFEKFPPYQIVHIGMFRIDGVLIEGGIYSRPIAGVHIGPESFSFKVKWAVSMETEGLMRPWNILSHQCQFVDDSIFSDMRSQLAPHGIKQAIVVPVTVRRASCLAIYCFPNEDFERHAHDISAQAFQIVTAILDRFPKLQQWPEDTKLSEREKEVLTETARGLSEREIADRLTISPHTVRNHLANAREKLEARNKVHAVTLAAQQGEIDLGEID